MKKEKISSSNFPIGSSSWKYARMLEEKQGHNYQHLNDALTNKLEARGYEFWKFKDGNDVTMSELEARDAASLLKESYRYVRIVTGREVNVQRIRMYSVIYKGKKNEK